MSRAKNWCFTINNYNDSDVLKLETMYEHGHFAYIVFGREVGQNGTPHLQGFVQIKKKLRLNQVKCLISPRAHLEIMLPNSTALAASTYCKKDGDFVELGERVDKGGKFSVVFHLLFNPLEDGWINRRFE